MKRSELKKMIKECINESMSYSQIDKLADQLSNFIDEEWKELFVAVDDRVTYSRAKKIAAIAANALNH